MVWGPAQFERDACEESVCRDQLLNQQLYWQKPGVRRKYLSWRHKTGDLSAYKWHLKPWEGERDVRKEEKPALRMPTFRETSCPQRETARREQAARAANVGESPRRECLSGPQVLWADRTWIPGQTQWGGGRWGRSRGRGGEEPSQAEHQHSRGKETCGRKEDTGREGKPVLVQCSSPLGQNLPTLDSALQAGWAEVQFPRCHGHKLEGPLEAVCCGQIRKSGIKQPYQAIHASPRMIFLGVSVLHLYHRWWNFTVLPWKIINREESLELIYLWEHESFLLQWRCAHSLSDKENCFIQEINYVLGLHTFIFVVWVYGLMHETLLCITYAE